MPVQSSIADSILGLYIPPPPPPDPIIIKSESSTFNSALVANSYIQIGAGAIEITPAWNAGTQVLTLSHALTSPSNELNIIASMSCSPSSASPNTVITILSAQDLSANALYTAAMSKVSGSPFTHFGFLVTNIYPADTSSHQYEIRLGSDPAVNITVNGLISSRKFGGTMKVVLNIVEIAR